MCLAQGHNTRMVGSNNQLIGPESGVLTLSHCAIYWFLERQDINCQVVE